MFGASHVSSPPFLVCEDATNGDMGSYLSLSDDNRKRMWKLLYQAALGLNYMHSKGMVHGYLKLSNILVGTDGQAKLSDFGLNTMRAISKASTSSSARLRWRAPECLKRRPTIASDVYSLAMCMIEATVGEPPFAYLEDDDVRENLKCGVIPEKPDEMNDEEWELVIAMTHVDPSKRAELSHVIDTLKRFSMEDLDEPRQGGTTRCITCAALVFNHSRCCAQCGNQLGLKEESRSSCGPPGSPNTPMELNTDTSVRDLVNVLRSETIEEQESAVLLLLQVCIRDHKRHQILDENGVPILVDLVKNGRTHFLKVCALGCLCWSSELDSTPSDDEFEELRETIPAAANTECNSIIQALQDQSDRDKVKTVVYCTCTAGTIGRKPLLNAGIIPPLVKLLRNGNETITIWTMDALGNMACDGDANSAIVAEGAIPMLLEHLKNGSETQRGFAACVLGQLSVETASNSAMIVEGGAIPFLVGLLRAQTNIPKNFAAFALDGIAAVNDDYGLEIARNGGIQRLIKLLRSGTNTHKTHAASGLARLANQEENRQEIGRRGVITDFIALLR